MKPNIVRNSTATNTQKLFHGPGFLKTIEKIQVNKVEVTIKNMIVVNMVVSLSRNNEYS